MTVDNSNGLSESGEVQPLSAHGIESLSTRYQLDDAGMPYHPKGVRLTDRTTRPTYDWIAPSYGE